ncbi:RNA ligase [Gordonia phage Chidiebere]|uniref:RNA ligase n=1 Tax=Gordonia phage Chidiebere TaxID=2656530 RepID=A0A649VKJ0_9CAUD|nr:RNA ligase [Gordonia phage Chidiebere]QGJ92916.1 RNA ligase [Gordonia phage Chidiebere]
MHDRAVDIHELNDLIDALGTIAINIKSRSLTTMNYDGSDCISVEQLAVANRCTQTKAAVWAALNSDGVLRRSGIEYLKALHPAPPSNGTGVMICLTPDFNSRQQMAMQGGDDPGQLHCTLYYAGSTEGDDQVSGAMLVRLKEIAHTVAHEWEHGFITAQANGITRFSGEDEDACVVNIDSPLLPKLYNRLVWKGVMGDNMDFREPDHGFSPHITLGYLDHDSPMPVDRYAAHTVKFRNLEMWVGGEITSWPLGATPALEEGEYDEPEGKPEGPEDEAIPYSREDFLETVQANYGKDVFGGGDSFPRRRRHTTAAIVRRARHLLTPPTEEKR